MFEWENMSAENWLKVKKALREVLDAAPSERQKILENGISAEIRAEVESLLAFEAESADFLSLPITDFSKDFGENTQDSAPLPAGQRIGIYEISRELGIGGMGAVYLAERTDGKFAQKVALKMLKREFNVEKIRRNFRREREILSKLKHPFITHLLDAGTTDEGVPYLVMEYVEGVPIDKFCARENLSIKDRLKLFNKVCEAVSFAHQNLIIHRDLKPSNIIVTPKGEPKLLDFGISKLLDADEAAENTSVTLLGAMTPEYASPEQIKGETVSTATDIYSLGVVLYKMLTGNLPYKFNGKSNGDVLKAITDEEPISPSSFVLCPSQFDNDEKQRIKDEGLRAKSLKGDLDNIILKSLRKEPERRYKTVEQFSADIWRHLDGLPVFARRATVSYRAAKFFRRNKIAVIAGLFVFLSLITGIAVAVWQAREARAQAAIAVESQRLAEIETSKAKTEQAKSEKISRFMSKLIGYANPNWYAEGAPTKGQARVLDALEDLSDKIDQEFANEPDVAAELHHKFGESLSWAMRQYTGETAARLKKKTDFHIVRALELRKQFYGEHHELVAKDMFYAIAIVPKNWQERAEMLMKAMTIMRETNPNNLNYPYMIESYTHRLMQPDTEETHEIYLKAVLPPTDENKYQIAEKMLRESLPVFRLHYKEDNYAIFAAECKLAYTLAVQEKWTDFDEHYSVCRQSVEKLNDEKVKEEILNFVELVENVLAEKIQNGKR
jgi:serine/threonine protein kinase